MTPQIPQQFAKETLRHERMATEALLISEILGYFSQGDHRWAL